MRQILDKEMPERKRRLLFWIPLFSGVIIAGAILVLRPFQDRSFVNLHSNELATSVETRSTQSQSGTPDQDLGEEVEMPDVTTSNVDRDAGETADEKFKSEIDGSNAPVQNFGGNEALNSKRQDHSTPTLTKPSPSEAAAPKIHIEPRTDINSSPDKVGSSVKKPALAKADAAHSIEIEETVKTIEQSEPEEIQENTTIARRKGDTSSEEEGRENMTRFEQLQENNKQEASRANELAEDDSGSSATMLNPIEFRFARNVESSWIYDLSLLNSGSLHVEDKIEPERTKIEIDFALSAGLLMDHKFDNLSWQAGASSHVIIRPWLSVGLGLYYWKIHSDRFFVSENLDSPNLDRTDFTLRDPGFIADMEQVGGVDSNASAVDERLIGSTDRLRYLRIPLEIRFFPRSTWQPHFGVSQFILVKGVQSEFEALRSDFSATNVQVSAATDFVRKRNIAYEIGVAFYPGRHFYADFNYSHGMRSYLRYNVRGSGFSELHRHFRLSLGYRF